MFKKTIYISILISILMLAGCGFHTRSAKDFPPQLQTLDLKTANPYSGFSTKLTQLLKSMDVSLTSLSPYTLNILSENFITPHPTVTSTTEAISYVYTFNIQYNIAKHNKILIGPTNLSASQTVTMNVNQIYNSNSQTLVKNELEQRMITLLYNQLISDNTKTALTK